MKSGSIVLCTVVVTLLLSTNSIRGELSLTTSVQHGVRKTHEVGELIFEDNFDTLDFDKWEHEITMSGGGNWEFQVPNLTLSTILYKWFPQFDERPLVLKNTF